MKTREYGDDGRTVIVLHGGPGAAGYMAPVARELAHHFHVLEPFQRGSGDTPLTVMRHVRDLRELIESRCGAVRPAIVGSSWGAMLSLAFAAEHPTLCGPLVLIGCGTFDLQARARMNRIIDERMSDALQDRLVLLETEVPDADERLKQTGALLEPLYAVAPLSSGLGDVECDGRAFHETWNDMLRQQQNGTYPAAFGTIDVPVLMLHGAEDPHPGTMIRDSLLPFVPQLEYVEWSRCGHYPWIERGVRVEFFRTLKGWLDDRFGEAT